MDKVARLLIAEAKKRNTNTELNIQKPDPLMVAKKFQDEYIALICALFSYGSARLIVQFLQSLDFKLLWSDDALQKNLEGHYYRLQSNRDIVEFFTTMRLLVQHTSVEQKFCEGYLREHKVMQGLQALISYLYDLNPYRSRGYEFLIGKIPPCKPVGTYKRWHMYLRWMVRRDNLDLGLWTSVRAQDLLMPLDTHTFHTGKKLGLIQRKSYDYKAVLELTQALANIDPNDPLRFDFALYRLGQEKLLG